jgi:hypothetical protein
MQARAVSAETLSQQLKASEHRLAAHLISCHAVSKAIMVEEWQSRVDLVEQQMADLIERQEEAEAGRSEVRAACKELTRALQAVQKR